MWSEEYKKAMDNRVPSSEAMEKINRMAREGVKSHRRYALRNAIAVAVCAAIIFTLVQPINDGLITSNRESIGESNFVAVKSIKELYSEVNRGKMIWYKEAESLSAPSTAKSGFADSVNSYSKTNIQVEGIDEADTVKTDGNYIYVAKRDVLRIYEADNGKTKLVSKINTQQEKKSDSKRKALYYVSGIKGLYVQGDRIIIITSDYDEKIKNYITEAWIYDVSDRLQPRKVNRLAQTGEYEQSRMMDDKLIFITRQAVFESEEKQPETFVPTLFNNDMSEQVAMQDVYVDKVKKDSQKLRGDENVNMSHMLPSKEYVNISSIDTTKECRFIDTKSLLCGMKDFYMNQKNMFLGTYSDNGMSITKIEIDEDYSFHIKASCDLKGYLDNQFSMDEYKDVLRVVVTDYERDSNALYTFDSNLKKLGAIRGIAKGERVYSARFMGDVGYFVTFKQVDPLFAVDLSNPKEPKLMSKLKLPGFSDYLHIINKDRLFGFGMEADERTGQTECLKLSMFDTSDNFDVYEKYKLEIKGERYSEALYNHRVLMFYPEKSLIGFPASKGYMIYKYSDENGFEKVKYSKLSFSKGKMKYSTIDYLYSMRCVCIGDFAYVIGNDTIESINLN